MIRVVAFAGGYVALQVVRSESMAAFRSHGLEHNFAQLLAWTGHGRRRLDRGALMDGDGV